MLTVEIVSVVRGVSIAYGVYLLLPITLLFVGSFGETWTNTIFPEGISGRWYVELWSDKVYLRAFKTSLIVALSACIINTFLSIPLAYSLYHRSRRKGSLAAKIVSMMPVAVPVITLAFGYIIIFNTDTAPLLGTWTLLIAAHAIQTLPYLTNTLLSDLRHMDLAKLEDAAATLGASSFKQFTSIVIPNLRQSLISGLVMVAAISVGEFGISNLITAFSNRTYPIVLLQAFYKITGFASAASVILLLLACLSALLSSILVRRS